MASTRTDRLLDFPDGVVVRETKTVAEAAAPESPTEVFERYPQVALALCLLADGLDPLSGEVHDEPMPARVELELLSVDSHEVRSFDAADATTVLQARAALADAVDRILYTEPSPNPGPWCSWCRVSQWCSAAQEPSPTADAFAEPVSPGAPTRVALLAYAETVAVDDDDIPF